MSSEPPAEPIPPSLGIAYSGAPNVTTQSGHCPWPGQQTTAPQSDSTLYKLYSKVNRMNDLQLIGMLKSSNLNVAGSTEVRRKRLKEYIRRKKTEPPPSRIVYSHILVIDFEATCDSMNDAEYKHEIIEFPAILYDTRTRKEIDAFHAFCQPTINPLLTEFCRNLTGIDQETVDRSKTFAEVLADLEQWMMSHGLEQQKLAVACDCNADMGKFMRIQCAVSHLLFPKWAHCWINVRKAFKSFYQVTEKKLTLSGLLEHLGLKFEGHLHSGLDDARNILRIVDAMLEDGCDLRVNERYEPNNPPTYTVNMSKRETEQAAGGYTYPISSTVTGAGCSFVSPCRTRPDNKPVHSRRQEEYERVYVNETEEGIDDLMRLVQIKQGGKTGK